MKVLPTKILSFILTFAILLSMTAPSFAAEQGENVELTREASENMELAPNISVLEIGFLDMEGSGKPSLSKRDPTREDNLIFPGPLAEKSAYPSKGRSSIYLAAYLTGKRDQYYCMMIYKGTDLTAEPVAMDSHSFAGVNGYNTFCLHWEKQNAEPGRYTLVTFTGEEEGDYIVPVENTASTTDIYVYDTAVPTAKEIYMVDFETGERVERITVPFGYTTVFEIRRTPLPSDGSMYATLEAADSDISPTSPDLADVRDAGGYFFITPNDYGTQTYRLTCGNVTRNYTLEVCYYPDGHHYGDPIPAGTATAETQGCTLYYCDGCGYVKKDFTPSYNEIFQGFRDVPEDSWYYSAVLESVRLNLFNGVNATTFGPDRPMTRAMLVTVLWRYEGEPSATAAEFTDVTAKDWFGQAVGWAAEQGIVNGVGNGKFNPNGTITREQLATILYRYAQGKGLNTQISADPGTFPDGDQVNSWAMDAFSWALGYELISGVKSGNTITLKPQGQATRAQVSTILLRFIQKSKEEAIVLPDLSTALYGGELETDEGTDLTWALSETGLLQIGGTVSENWSPDQWKLPWYPYREQITAVEFLPGVESVWTKAFSGYSNLQSVKIASTVQVVKDAAFYNCPMLEELQLGDGLRALDRAAFQSCTSLETVDLPDSLLDIGTSSFAGCTSLKELYLPRNLKSIGTGAFKLCRSLEVLILPDSVQKMGRGTFENCASLKQVKLSYSLAELPNEAFVNCGSLVDVILPIALEEMGIGVFYRCSSLEELLFPAMFNRMYVGSFTECTSLKALFFLGNDLRVFEQIGNDTPYDRNAPFGSCEYVTVYGIVGSDVEYAAKRYGYTFVDILTILE